MRTLNSYLSIILFSILIFPNLSAQELPKMEWDKIYQEDLRMKRWATDSTADAAVLGDFGHIMMTDIARDYTGFVLTRHYRIKIFNKKAFDRANIRILYYAKDDYEYILKIKAQTVLPNGTRIPVESKSFFTEKLNKYFSVEKFTFPNVAEGCVLEFQYELASRNIFSLKEWQFQDDIPTRYSFLNVNIESRFAYTTLLQGKDVIKETEINYDNNGTAYSGTEYPFTHFSLYATDLKALKEEAFVSTTKNYVAKANFQLVDFADRRGTKQKVYPTWEKTVKELLDRSDFGDIYLKKSKYDAVWEKMKNIIAPTDSALQKINKIYDWVNENIEWNNEIYDYSADNTPNDVFKNHRGSSADINLLLIALLREAGIDANPIILSTREQGKPFVEFAFLRQYNHTIAHVDFNGKPLLLDCGDINRPPGILRVAAYNGQGFLVRKKDPKWFDISPPLSTLVSVSNFTLTDEGKMKGSIGFQFKGIVAVEKRTETGRDETGKILKEVIAKKWADWAVDSVLFKSLKDSREPLQENLYLKINNVGQINDDFMYVKPTLQSGWEKSPFKLQTRYYPVEFPNPINEQYVLNLKIPKGYKIEEIPKTTNFTLPPDDAKFQYLIAQQGDNVNLIVKIVIKRTVFSTENYPFLKKFFDDIAAKLDEQIVLKKVSK
jgi:Domain of Unknown Function with PDB structure (DUF3857)/Transglutaminase-like superfamily